MSLIETMRASSELGSGSAAYVEQLYESWLQDETQVSAEWAQRFSTYHGREAGDLPHAPIIAQFARAAKLRPAVVSGTATDAYAEKQSAVRKLVNSYRARGHLRAQIDPLGMMTMPAAPDLDLADLGLNDADLDTEFSSGSLSAPPRMKLRAIIALLKASYASTIGSEFMHIHEPTPRRWIQQQLETTGGNFGFSVERQRRLLERLTATEGLERYLHTRYVGQKRFSLEGGDAFIVLMDALIQR
ncbi:MAG: 2-oxoglutarate dehydrogenase E1 component, partial [Lysobacterales bacterium CG_4_9_14_3_um_filter_62_6]